MVDLTRGPVAPGMMPVPPAEVKDVELYHPHSWVTKYVFSQDAKVIALQYASTALAIGLVALVLSWLMRLQLAFPGSVAFIDADHYYQFITMHGMIMVIYLITAIFLGGFGNYLIPLMLGARDMVFPYLNMLSYWVYLLAVLILVSSFFAPGGPTGAGWTLYPPQAVLSGTPGRDWGIILMLVSLIFFIAGFTMGGLNYVVTVLQGRTRGMTLMRMPLTVWGIFTATVMALLAFPALFVAAVMMLLDRLLGTSFFMPSVVEMGEHLKYGGGSPILFQHLFWFFGHPEVYIVALPAFGIVSDLISTHARKNIFGYRMMVWAIVGIGALSFIVWAHHMYVSGMNPYFGFFFAFTTLIIAIPTAIKVYNWVLTLWRGDIHLTVPMLFALGFLVTFVNGGLTGLFLGNVVVDVPLSDTMFVVAHFHMVMGVAPILVIFGAIYHWYPKITGRMLDDMLGKFHFWVTFIGAYAIFFPMHYLGLLGVPRRYYAMGDTAFVPHSAETLNVFMTVAALIVGFAQMVFIFNVIWSLRHGRAAGGNPWGAASLEWQTPQTPPSHGNWGKELPIVYRWAYDYSVPGAARDFVPQNQASIDWIGEAEPEEMQAGHALVTPAPQFISLLDQPMEGATGGPTIRNPIEWGWDQLRHGAEAMEHASQSVQHTAEHLTSRSLTVRRIEITDLKEVLRKGLEDFGTYRTDVIFLCIVYPMAGLIFARVAFHYELVPLLFPLASGFALIGPFAAVGLYEMSRKRELALHRHQEFEARWTDAFEVFRCPNFGAILLLGLGLIAMFLVWLAVAWGIYQAVHVPQPQESVSLFIQEVFLTPAGWWLIVLGCGAGFLFALLAMVIGVASFPLLLDRDVGLATAVATSFRVVAANPKPMAAWGLIVAAGLILGSLPLFIGLVIVLPVLGHATWHLYRRLIAKYPSIPFGEVR